MNMSLREQINEHKKLTTIGLVILIAAAFYMLSFRNHDNTNNVVPSQAFFTFDDGKTWFVDSSRRIPPFEYNGKTAVRAYVFSKGGSNYFVGYLEQFTPAAKKEMEATVAASIPGPHPPPFSAPTLFAVSGRELKRPGDSVWVSASDIARASEICSVRGYGASAMPVQP
jgi:hypothetical protein